MKSITISAKTVEEAISLALNELKSDRDNVEVKVIDKGSKGFIGLFGKKNATIKVSPKFDAITSINEIVLQYLKSMNMSAEVNIKAESNSHISVNIPDDNLAFLIGKHGATLDALEHIINLAINRKSPYHMYITLNIGNYLEKRKETLEHLALNIAQKVKQTKKSYSFEPMKSSERKIIHSALQNINNIKTHSVGEEPERKIVVSYVE